MLVGVITAALLLWLVLIALLPEWMIAGFHFHWPWRK